MILLIGLGNPGHQYKNTRHNLGFLVIERLAIILGASPFQERSRFRAEIAETQCNNQKILLVKPSTFINDSGASVGPLVQFHALPLENLWVVHDDLDLPPGTVRFSFNSRSAGHNGVQSIIDSVGSKEFHRFRIGIGRPETEHLPADRFVLARYPAEQWEAIEATLTAVLPAFALDRLGCPPQ